MTAPPVLAPQHLTALDPELHRLSEQLHEGHARGVVWRLAGQGSKAFYGEPWTTPTPTPKLPPVETLDTRVLTGISSYEPTELVVTARAGTPLAELEAALAVQHQCLPFEPPRFGGQGTVGGMVAAGLSGPPRAAVGAVRDYVLGATLINPQGQVMSFGGQVIKNVAGYDLSRLLAGSLGTLGLIAEVSLKVLPVAPTTATLRFVGDQDTALHQLNVWAGQPWPLNASVWFDGVLWLRLRGAEAAVAAAVSGMARSTPGLGAATVVPPDEAHAGWLALRDHTHPFFAMARQRTQADHRLWRLGVPSTTAVLDVPGQTLIEWGGAQRWLWSSAPVARVREAAQRCGGHATVFYGADLGGDGVFHPLSAPLARIHRQLKVAFDPQGRFNPGRMYPGL